MGIENLDNGSDVSDLKTVATAATTAIKAAIDEEEVSFELNCVADNYKLNISEELLHQALSIIYVNAIKTAPVGSKIVTTIANEKHAGNGGSKGNIIVKITNPQDSQLQYLPQESSDFKNATSFSVCSDIIKEHGGDIESKVVGDSGSEVIFYLPSI